MELIDLTTAIKRITSTLISPFNLNLNFDEVDTHLNIKTLCVPKRESKRQKNKTNQTGMDTCYMLDELFFR